MRNILALVAAFTLSSSTATAVACGNDSGTTIKVFNWNQMINDSAGWTSEDLLQFLLDNTNTGIGQSLYKDVVDYVSLSILKTDASFAADKAFADITVTNQLKNEQDSLKNKYGRSWEKKWKEILKDPSNGGDGKDGSYSRYFDSKLKALAANIITQHYVTDNYNNFKYYEQSRVQLWLQDLFNAVKPPGTTPSLEQIITAIENYVQNGTYQKFVWIIAKANDPTFNPKQPDYTSLATSIQSAITYADVIINNQVPQTPNDDPNSNNYIVDTNSANSIKGLLSNQQADIARLWIKNQGPLWTRQIVVKFNDTVKDPLTKPITADLFSQQTDTIQRILKNIQSEGGFYLALDEVSKHNIAKVSTSSDTGDLGLNATLNADKSKIKPSFSYYVDRYVTSAQGIGSSKVAPFNLATYSASATPSTSDVERLINDVNRSWNNNPNALEQTSQFRDEVVINDNEKKDTSTTFSGANGQNKVAVFIDEDGLHFVQTPGIAYRAKLSQGTNQKIITDFNSLLQSKNSITWQQAETVTNRPGGLTSNSYLAYLQTQFLKSKSNDTSGTGAGVYFDLNSSLKTFVTDSSQALNSKNWWDYILYFNNNIKNINWNINSDGLSKMLNNNITASGDVVNKFTQTLKNWFVTTNQQRWNSLQGIASTDTLKSNIKDWNDTLNKNTSPTVTPARLDANDLIWYLTNVADSSIWWYDPNSIKS